jgi:chemotaxis protein methyltransferase CheR
MSAALSMDAIEPVAALVARRTGLFFPDLRRQALAAAIANAIARTRARTAADLVELLESVPAAFDELVAELTVHESYFFRDPGQFEVLRRDVLPEILRRRGPDHRLRLVSVGCAAGEEPYSLALLLDQEGLFGRSVVIGTDISRPSLAQATRASYGNWSLRGSAEDFRSRYFQREGERFRLIRRIRDRVEFRYLNLAEEFHPSHATGIVAFDVIFCRNALIYFDAASVAGAAARLFSALAEGGWLVTGASDPPLAGHAPFETVMTPAGLLYRRPHGLGRSRASPSPGCGTGAVGEYANALLAAHGEPNVLAPAFEPAPSFPEKASGPRSSAASTRAPPPEAPCAQDAGTGPEPPAVRIRALADAGRIAEALEEAVAVSRQQPASAEVHYLHAVLLSETCRDREAADLLRRALYLDGQLAVAALALGLALRRLGDRDGARRALGHARAVLAGRPADERVTLGDGEVAGRLLVTIEVQIRLLEGARGERPDQERLR